MSRAGKGYLTVFIILIGIIITWNYTIRKPQINTAETFLEALKQRNANALKQTVVLSEYDVYRELYLKNGYNKHLLSYGNLAEKDANGHFFPTQSRYSVTVEENDILFGKRTQEYQVALQKDEGQWRVLQFVTLEDYADLAVLKEFKPATKKTH